MMYAIVKSFSSLTSIDLAECPVWEYVPSPDASVVVSPVDCRPVIRLSNRIVGTRAVLNNGDICWAILGNVHLYNKQFTEHFLCLSVEHQGMWFDLARYHDVDYARRGPDQLADFLGLPVDSVFPINYDISDVATGNPECVRASIPCAPLKKLTAHELTQLAVKAYTEG